jgi:septal ring factor EnvC (AmiA/AmiB activator)
MTGQRITAIIFSAALSLLAATSAVAENAPRDKEAVSAEISKKQSEAARLAKETKDIEAEVEALKQKLVTMSRDLQTTENGLAETSQKLKELNKEKSVLARQLYQEQGRMGGLVTAAQRFNRTSTPTMLVESDPLDAARAARIMKSMIPAIHAKSAALQAKIETLSRLEQDISHEKSAKAKKLSSINEQEAKLAAALEKRKALYHQTEAERKKQQADIARLTKEAKTLDELVQKINLPIAKPAAPAKAPRTAGNKHDKTPHMMYAPVAGVIRTAFGATDDLGAPSKGITYNARSGARVSTPLAGKVRFAGPFKKYKHILIIEHAGGYHSLIAGLGQVDTIVGASLAAGEPVGSAADTQTDEHPVYYELRHNGAPVNPHQILIAQRKQDKS